jgi:acyl-homoserine-lactone acylase
MLSLLVATLRLAGRIEIDLDKYGVPSIFAATDADAAYGLGYEQGLNVGTQMATSYKLARGRYSEVVGKKNLLTDGFIRSMGFEDAAEKAAQNPPDDPAIIDAFLEGANKAIAERKAKGTAPAWVPVFTRIDVYALTQFVNAGFPLMDFQASLSSGTGSNQFAVAPQRTATRHPILSLDPHLNFEGGDLILWFEFAQYTPQGSFRGVSIPGLPTGVMGHNDRVAWSQTNNNPILTTRFKVVTQPGDSSQYSYHGEWRKFGSKKIELGYLEDGQIKTTTQTVRMTDWGPMIPLHAEALYCPLIGRFQALSKDAQITKAKSVFEFRTALAKRGISMWNYVIADVDGNIGYQYNATLPSRNPDFPWRGAVPGNDPNTKLGDLIPYDDLPHVMNPKSGFLVNCNSAPWLTATSGEISDQWPNFVTSYGHTTRYDRLSELLKGDSKISVDAAKRYATDTLVPDGTQTAQALIEAGADADAAKVFKAWDGRADLKSVGCALYAYWLRQDSSSLALTVAAGAGKKWSADEAKTALANLTAAEEKLKQEHGRLDVPWSEILYLERGKKQVSSGGYGYIRDSLAAVRPTSASSASEYVNGKIHATRGSSVRMIVSLVPGHVQSWSVLPYGESWVPGSPHYDDQMELYGAGQYKDTHFGAAASHKAAVEKVFLDR